jgi:PAS domain S-box-containing protein
MGILLAVSDSAQQKRLTQQLVKWGYPVIAAQDGQEAWQILQEAGCPRIALLEDALPGLTGVEVCQRARQRPDAPFVYMVLLTAGADSGNRVAALEAGADDCLPMSGRPAELRARILAGVRLAESYESLARRLSPTEEGVAEPFISDWKLRLLTDAMPVQISYVDSTQRYQFNNKSYETWFGQPRAAFHGKHIKEILGDEIYQVIRPHAEAALSGQQVMFEIMANYRAVGKRHVHVTYVPDLKQDKVQGFFAIIQDMTQSKRIEAETHALQADLARAEQLARLGVLAGALAHELSQPLAAMFSNAQAALRFLDAETPNLGEIREILEDIVKDDRRAKKVIDRVRALAKQAPPRHDRLTMRTLVRNVLRLTRSQAHLNQIVVEEELPDNAPCVVGDRTQVQQVLLNLVTNAMEAVTRVPPEQRRIRISAELGEEGRARICVRDQGPGIPADRLATLFEPFRASMTEGLRIGLAVSRTIATGHGGRIWIENNPTGGVTSCLELPRTE